ncbi:ATP-dependent endonuclease [Populibacterium corticicola]|uniref:ATP-dependent endonuclease n=1 Tax=Populibacterium corticicola TaxID=1812826 RepID=A0ABW5XFY7_9MICO
MRLTRFKVENHGRLSDLEIEVREHLVLVGANDVGKSSFLRCLDLILGASTARLYAAITAADFRDPGQPFVVEVDLEDFNVVDLALFPDEISVNPNDGNSKLTIRLFAEIDDSETISIMRSAPSAGSTRQLSRDQVLGLGWKFLSANSQTRELREDRKSPLAEILAAVDLGVEKPKFEAITTALTTTLGESAVLGTLRSDLAGQLSKALPELLAKDDLTLIPGASADNDVLSDVRLQVAKAGVPRDLSEQSDGMKALFAIAFYDLISGVANVVGIDEPEVHLHPTSQRSLARLLRDRPNQKIIATHSSDIVSAFDPDSIVVVRQGGNVVQPAAGFLSTEEKLVASWWVRGRLEPLTSRRAIAVEGASDRIIVERAADLTGRNLDRLGVSLVDAGGKNSMSLVEKLFGAAGFNVPLSILVDEDAETAAARRHGIPTADLPTRSIWISRTDLEDEYVRALGAAQVWEAFSSSTLFSARQLSKVSPSGPDGALTTQDVAAFCRNNKVEAALVVAEFLTEETARAIASVESVLAEAAGA